MRSNVKKMIFLVVLFLAIGFAAVSTTLIMNGTIMIGANTDDFDVIFTKSILDRVDVSDTTIASDGKSITFETNNLSKVDDFSVLQFEVTNNSTQYDASIEMICEGDGDNSEYYTIYHNYPEIVYARSKDTGEITVKLNKTTVEPIHEKFVCTLIVNAIEKDDEVIIDDSENVELNYSAYNWSNVPLLEENIDETISFLKEMEIKDLYQSFNYQKVTMDRTYEMVSKLNSNGIDTYFLSGATDWYNSPDKIKSELNEVIKYNNSADQNEKIKGMVLDIEVHLTDAYRENAITALQTYANTVETIYTYCRSNGFKLVTVMPYGFDVTFFNEGTYNEEEQELLAAALKKIYSNSDRISVMNYYKSAMVESMSYEIALAEELGIEIESVGEFNRPRDGISEAISLWVEDNPVEYAKNIWKNIYNEYDYNKTYFSYHDLTTVMQIKGLYKNYLMDVKDENGNTVNVNYVDVIFENGSYENIHFITEMALPADMDFTYYFDEYDIISVNFEDVGDQAIQTTIVVKKAETYQVEAYPNLYNGTNYESIKSGTLTFTNVNNDKEVTVTVGSGGYGYIGSLRANTKYKLTAKDENGNEHVLVNVTSRDADGNVHTISDEDGYVTIPANFNTTKYMGMDIYLKSNN